MVVFGFEKLCKTSWDSLFLYSNGPFWLLVISQFPTALYLNRNQNKTTSQSINVNVS